jgi:hypothetical protein
LTEYSKQGKGFNYLNASTMIDKINYYYLEFAKTVRTSRARARDIVSSKQSTKQDKARQAVQALLNMTPHLDKQTS